MEIFTLHTSICITNTYVIIENAHAVVLDPGGNAQKIISFVESKNAKIDCVLITHCHFDHIGAAADLKKHGARIAMSKTDYLLLVSCGFDVDLGFGNTSVAPFDVDMPLSDGDVFELIGHRFEVISTPGHTPGGVSFVLDEKYIFSGDTLFDAGVGRTDFPYCDEGALIGSVLRLFALDGDYAVLPGHGDATTLSAERCGNAYAAYSDIKKDIELYDVARLFFGDDCPNVYFADYGKSFDTVVAGKHYKASPNGGDIPNSEHKQGRLRKIALYDALSAHTGRKMPWGALTGVRPSKLFYECVEGGKSESQARDIMENTYRVSPSRARILSEIYDAQKGKIRFSDEYVNLYVHIPYCTTRCSYCSFVSEPISKCMAQSEVYAKLLCDEISRTLDFIADNGKKVLSVYVGGGTPTALDVKSLESVLSAMRGLGCEFTCEAGRPDTIDEQKLDVMKRNDVTRVCVNPQTLNDTTLARIGRAHTADDFYAAYELVKRRGFAINCDLIAGLDAESTGDFIKSFDGIVALEPQNITVHSLAKKNGSGIRYERAGNTNAAEMVDYALENIGAYRPYYLYRQKRQACNLENVGFSLSGFECVNNITTMEETVSVIACGAGAISKLVKDGYIGRFAAMRDVKLYIERYEQKLKEKFEFFKNGFAK